MTAADRVSVVIPVHNGERYLAEAIQSVLDQTHAPLECLVIDDGSTDATQAVVAGFGDCVSYVRRARGGVSAARNHGLRLARGELIAFLDHDDVWLADRLARQLSTFAEQSPTLVLCGVQLVDDTRRAAVSNLQAPL